MNKKITIGSRGSKLALIYAQIAKDKIVQNTFLNEEDVLIKEITTKGDQVHDVRLSEVGGKGLFSKNIENELWDKKIDIAVHALKDLPAIETKGLITDTYLERNDPREILIAKNNQNLKELKSNSVIGTSSFRREFQIRKIRKDLNCKIIRGNVDTRIKKLNDGSNSVINIVYPINNTLNIQVQALRASISELEGKRLVSSIQYGENHEAVNEIKKRINNLKNQLDQKVASRSCPSQQKKWSFLLWFSQLATQFVKKTRAS